jgi:hypothetical protein
VEINIGAVGETGCPKHETYSIASDGTFLEGQIAFLVNPSPFFLDISLAM